MLNGHFAYLKKAADGPYVFRRQAYTEAVEKRITAIREEEALATTDHSFHAWDLWEKAGFAEEDTRKNALAANRQYDGGLREADYGILTTEP